MKKLGIVKRFGAALTAAAVVASFGFTASAADPASVTITGVNTTQVGTTDVYNVEVTYTATNVSDLGVTMLSYAKGSSAGEAWGNDANTVHGFYQEGMQIVGIDQVENTLNKISFKVTTDQTDTTTKIKMKKGETGVVLLGGDGVANPAAATFTVGTAAVDPGPPVNPDAATIEISGAVDVKAVDSSAGVYEVTVPYTAKNIGTFGVTMLSYAKGSSAGEAWGDDADTAHGTYAEGMQIVGITQEAAKTGADAVVKFRVTTNEGTTGAIKMSEGETGVVLLGGHGVTNRAAATFTIPVSEPTTWDVKGITFDTTTVDVGVVNVAADADDTAILAAVEDAVKEKLLDGTYKAKLTGDDNKEHEITLDKASGVTVNVGKDGDKYIATFTVPKGTYGDAIVGETGVTSANIDVTAEVKKPDPTATYALDTTTPFTYTAPTGIKLATEDEAALKPELVKGTLVANVVETKGAAVTNIPVTLTVTEDMITALNLAKEADTFTGTITVPAATAIGTYLTLDKAMTVDIAGAYTVEDAPPVVTGLLGDVTENDVVDSLDLAALANHVSKFRVVADLNDSTTSKFKKANINGDKEVNSLDLAALANHISKFRINDKIGKPLSE